ncbi:MAG: ABC transporter ATP-binding protein [Paenibacillus sp.]|uniref:ABC transporter ATP-binding protein n=1 Tax=Paenibacillus sp. TaxID=58172 RepID=UPI0029065FAA|nr:ABC transporter ATP-binding protein [Paenibacillus sp.]MDU4695750.1 ABC transporter ATP-binding protein [Paenibacillus sp.]
MNEESTLKDTAVPALEVRQIHKTFRDRRRDVPVLRDISLRVPAGQFVSIIGPSGCGKSTLFHVIGGLTAPEQGEVLLQGRPVTGQRGHISYVPQQPALFPWRTIEDNVVLAQEIAGTGIRSSRAEIQHWLDKAGLGGFERAYPHMLSGGMQQRASFLRGLLAPQEVMCLDEPFSALDALTRSEMQRWLLDIWEENKRSVLMITHSIEEALMLSDTIVLFSNRPASVLHTIQVPFPRPRREEITEDSDFIRLKREIAARMAEEQRKTAAGGI